MTNRISFNGNQIKWLGVLLMQTSVVFIEGSFLYPVFVIIFFYLYKPNRGLKILLASLLVFVAGLMYCSGGKLDVCF